MISKNNLLQKVQLKEKSIAELEKLYENLTTKNDYDFTTVIEVLISKYQLEKDNTDRVEKLQIEQLVSNIRKDNTTNNRFPSLKRPEIITIFTEEKIQYLKNRISQTTNPILKAKYSDVVYELNKKEIQLAKTAIVSYLDSSKIYLKNQFEFKLIDAVERALSLSLLIKETSLIEQSYLAHSESIPILNSNKDYFGFMGVIESLTERKKKLKTYNLDFKLFEKYIEEIIKNEQNPSQSTYNLHRSLLSLLLSFPNIKADVSKSKLIRVRIADAFISEGDHVGQTRSQWIGAKFLENALKIHISIGSDKSVIDNLKKRIRIANENGVKNEFKKVPFEFSISTKVIDNYLSLYEDKKEDEIYNLLRFDDQLIPNYNHIKKTLIKNSHPIMPFHQSAMRGGIKVKNVTTIDDKIEHEAIMQIMLCTEFISRTVLDKIFDLIKKEYPAYSKGLIEKINSSDLVDNKRKVLIKHGIERYEAKDYISSMHVLVFQIEGILKDTLYAVDGATFNFRSNEMRELTLGTIIRNLIEKEIFDKNLLKFIEVNLCEIRAKNIRNDIAHGNLNTNHFTRNNNQVLLLILLKITGYKIKNMK